MKIAHKIPLIGLAICLAAGGGMAGAAEVVKERAEANLRAECVAPEAYKRAQECPAGPKEFGGKVKHKTAFKSAPPPRERKERQDDLGPKNASESIGCWPVRCARNAVAGSFARSVDHGDPGS